MVPPAGFPPQGVAVAALLGDELARADRSLAQVGPVLRHRVESPGTGLFSDRIVSQVRSFLNSLAGQLIAAAENQQASGGGGLADPVETLAGAFAADPLILGHAHSLALEAELSAELAARLGLDPVLSPLLGRLAASADRGTARAAVALRDSQVCFGQAALRGELPLLELPGDLLARAVRAHQVQLAAAADRAGDFPAVRAKRPQADEGASRLGLLRQVVAALGAEAVAALDVSNAGVALFVTALALGSGQDRHRVLMTTRPGQEVRLVLALVASGLGAASVRAQVLALHSQAVFPSGLDSLLPEQAAALLAGRAP